MEGLRDLEDVSSRTQDLLALYPPHLRQNPLFKHVVNIFDGLLFAYMIRSIHGEEGFRDYLESLAKVVNQPLGQNPDLLRPTIEALRRFYGVMVRDFQLSNIPVDCSSFILGSGNVTAPVNTLHIPHVRVIDTNKISLKQILALREDETIMRQMRRFRLFAYEQYKGRDKAFIEDDIQKRLDDYSEAVKSSGFETTVKTLSFLFDSKLLFGACATSAVSLLLSNPQLAIGAFTAGAVVELGKLSLVFAKEKHALAEICRENPISYLADAKHQLLSEHE